MPGGVLLLFDTMPMGTPVRREGFPEIAVERPDPSGQDREYRDETRRRQMRVVTVSRSGAPVGQAGMKRTCGSDPAPVNQYVQ